MAKTATTHILSDLFVRKTTQAGRHNDGAGLYLKITPTGSKSWVFRYRKAGKVHDKGLGAYPGVGLADARKKAKAARGKLEDKVDPIQASRAEKAAEIEAAGRATRSFEAAAEELIGTKTQGWNNTKTAQRWRARLRDYAYPVIGKKHVADITPDDIVKCLGPIWYSKAETAAKTRGYIEAVLDFAGVKGWRDKAQNPAAWKGNLEHLGLRARRDFASVEHHPAMPYAELPAFFAELRKREAVAARGIELIILTAVRAGDVRLAPWTEFDLQKGLWTIPKARQLKEKENRRDHRVPLPTQAVALLEGIPRSNGFVFPGGRPDAPFSENGFMALMRRRMGIAVYDIHGFRSTFKDWAVEQTDYPDMLSEMALAHDLGSSTKKAYLRTDLFVKRRALMQDWADYCLSSINDIQK
jgi:integrase